MSRGTHGLHRHAQPCLRRPAASRRVPLMPDLGLASPRKQHALELFAGLPRHYDAAGAVLSFGQDPRWRRALVARCRGRAETSASSTSRPAPGWSRGRSCAPPAVGSSGWTRARRCSRGPRSMVAATIRRWPAGSPSWRRTPSGFPSPTASSTTSRSPTCCATSTIPAATLRELARVLKPGGRLGFAGVRRSRPRAGPRRCGGCYTRVGLPALGRLVSRDWYEVGRFLGPSIEAFDADHPLGPRSAGCGSRRGCARCEVRPMSFGAGVVMSGTRDGDPASP